jgi:transketolase
MARPAPSADLARLAVNTIKFLAVDAVEKAKSGHPGLPMGAADVAFVLWSRYLRFDPKAPAWPDRDRFVLSAGHGSMLLYALLHLSGFDMSLDDLRAFRQWESRTPGHPEYGIAPGIETTTGPLGQGFGTGVGMAIAAKMAEARFNRPGAEIFSHRIFSIVSDGDVMEGISHESASLAGHLGLGNLVYIYDSNHITIEGDTALALSDNPEARFASYGWHVQTIDGHDHAAIARALDAAIAETARPSLIVAHTHIANGAPHKHDSEKAHGEPLGAEELAATKKAAGWPLEPSFLVPEEVRAYWGALASELGKARADWEMRFAAWKKQNPDLAVQWDATASRAVPADLEDRLLAAIPADGKPAATRVHSGKVIQAAAGLLPYLAGGAADLDPSTKTAIAGSSSIRRGEFGGRVFHFGIREHAMGAALNGMSLHGTVLPYGGTFLIFSDYMRPPMRLAALMGVPAVFVFTHDTVFLGEDGPTHQPVEQLTGLRAIPNMVVLRPADGPETAIAWAVALRRREGPTTLVLTRQNQPPIERADPASVKDTAKGGYLVAAAKSPAPAAVLLASGSELSLALAARAKLAEAGRDVSVVSMPSLELFAQQPRAYRDRILPPGVRAVAIEAAQPGAWYRWIGRDGLAIGIERFGASAPYQVIAEKLGFTPERVAARVLEWL